MFLDVNINDAMCINNISLSTNNEFHMSKFCENVIIVFPEILEATRTHIHLKALYFDKNVDYDHQNFIADESKYVVIPNVIGIYYHDNKSPYYDSQYQHYVIKTTYATYVTHRSDFSKIDDIAFELDKIKRFAEYPTCDNCEDYSSKLNVCWKFRQENPLPFYNENVFCKFYDEEWILNKKKKGEK